MEEHQAAVSRISDRISHYYEQKIPFRLYHGSTNSTRQYTVDRNRMVDTSGLNHVLSIDWAKKTCLVEPNVPMDDLVDAVMPHGLLPPVVMEFPGITVGGGFAGTAGESSGFKYGFFDCVVNWIEIVLPTGEVVEASETNRADLFKGAAGSLGTLGVTTLLELQLIESRPYIEMTYHPASSTESALKILETETSNPANDYVDGILFSPTHGVIVTGKLTSIPSPGTPTQTFSNARDPWFYIHVERRTKAHAATGEPQCFATPTRDYLFRYDRGAFWTGRYAYKYFLTPFNRITRWALDYFMHTRVMYHALHASGHSSKYMIQDLMLPADTAGKFVQYVGEEFGFWPLWLCPLKVGQEISMRPAVGRGESGEAAKGPGARFVNVGVWGPGPQRFEQFVEVNRRLERRVRELGGVKWLYSQCYYTADEFWGIYDGAWYSKLREKYQATYLPDVYDKTKVDLSEWRRREATWSGWLQGRFWDVWPLSGLYGVMRTLMERDYLLAKS